MYNHLIAASDWPRSFFAPKVFLFSISLLFVTANACVEASHVDQSPNKIYNNRKLSIYIETFKGINNKLACISLQGS